jgi:hypothetical protein
MYKIIQTFNSVSSAGTEAQYRDAVEVLTFRPNFGNRHVGGSFIF